MGLIEAVDLSYSYGGAALVLSGANFSLEAGEVAYVSGPSGCGKSTFLRMLNRLLEPTSGELLFKGRPYGNIDVRSLRKKVHLVQQTPALFDMSVLQNLLLAAPNAGTDRITSLLEDMNLPADILEKNAKKLSVGQMQRVCVARSLLLDPEALLLDEPTAPLDPENAELFRTLVERMRAKSGLAAVWVTHDPDRAGRGGRRLVMAGGKLDGG